MQSSNDRTQIATTLARARALLDAGQFGEAAKLARNLLEEVPADARAWRLMSAVHLRGDRVDQATLCLQRAMACDPDDVTTMIQLGQCLARLARRREALAIADHVAGLPLDRPALDDGLGTLFRHCDEPLRALPFFERAVACMPESSDYLYNLSTAQTWSAISWRLKPALGA